MKKTSSLVSIYQLKITVFTWNTIITHFTNILVLETLHYGGYCSVTQSCSTPRDTKDCSTPGFPVLHYLPEFAQTHVHWVGDAMQPSRPLSFPPSAFSLSQHQGLFQRTSFSYPVAKVLELHYGYHDVYNSSTAWTAAVPSVWEWKPPLWIQKFIY